MITPPGRARFAVAAASVLFPIACAITLAQGLSPASAALPTEGVTADEQLLEAQTAAVSLPAKTSAERLASTELLPLLSLELVRARAKGAESNSLTPRLEEEANRYLANKTNSSESRYEVRAALQAFAMRQAAAESRDARMARRVRDARQLTKEFPNDARGYSYLMQIASGLPDIEAIDFANEVLAAEAPVLIKSAAKRLIKQRQMVGKI